MKSTFTEIQPLINLLAEQISIPGNQLPTYGSSIGDGTACIEIGVDGTVYYVVSERGSEFERWVPPSMDDLLYRVFKDATSASASQFELRNRIKGQDHRRIFFAEHERLIGVLNEDWQNRLNKSHQETLVRHPFDDLSGQRVDYFVELQSEGKSNDDAWKLACEKYPLPS
jgi:hypothetical protein